MLLYKKRIAAAIGPIRYINIILGIDQGVIFEFYDDKIILKNLPIPFPRIVEVPLAKITSIEKQISIFGWVLQIKINHQSEDVPLYLVLQAPSLNKVLSLFREKGIVIE